MLLSLLITISFSEVCVADINYQNVNPELALGLTNSQEIDIGVLSSLYREYKLAVDEGKFVSSLQSKKDG